MSGNKVNGTRQALTPANFRGETLQVFVFFQGQYLGYQCFVQDRVTIGGSPSMDLYLPACSPDEGHWSIQLAGGTLLAWFSPLEQDAQGAQKPQRRAVEPLDVFQLGEYRVQAKLLQASGFVGHYTGVESEPVKPAIEKPAGSGDTDPVKGADLEKVHQEVWGCPAEDVVALEGQDSAPAGQIRSTAAEDFDKLSEDLTEIDRTEVEQAREASAAKGSEQARPPEVREPASHEAPSPAQDPLEKDRTEIDRTEVEQTGEAFEVRDLEQTRPREVQEPASQQTTAPVEDKRREDLVAEWQAPAPALSVQQPVDGFEAAESASPARTEEELPSCEEPEGTDADEEEPEEEQVRYFSLIKEIFRDRKQAQQMTDPAQRALEVVRFRAGDVQEVAYLEQDGAYAIRKGWTRRLGKDQGGPPPNFKLVSFLKGGVAELHIREGVAGRFYSNLGSRDILNLLSGRSGEKDGSRGSGWQRKPLSIPLPADAWAVLRVDPFRYLVRYVPAKPKPPLEPIRPRITKSHLKILSASMISHVLLLLVIGLTIPKGSLEGYSPRDQFAKVDPNILKTLKPAEPLNPAKPLEAPVTQPKPLTPAKQKLVVSRPQETPKAQAQPQAAASTQNQTAPPEKQVDVRQTGLLAALDMPGAGGPGGNPKGQSQILLAAVTNLDAVSVPSDSTTFNLAGIAGKLGTSEIQIPTGDAIRTVGAQELMKIAGGSVGAMASRGTGSGQVKAVVREPPKANITIRGGMSREAVLSVVNQHLDEIRDCYERELLHNPGLTGKILMEWLIREDGSVAYSKVAFTNIGHSSDLHLCVQAQVTAWKFPRPTDNQEVVVTFPFLFENMGF